MSGPFLQIMVLIDRIHKAQSLVKASATSAAGRSRCLHGSPCLTRNNCAPVSFFPSSPIHATRPTHEAALRFTDVPRRGMWVKGHSAGYRWERPFWGDGISSCGEACTQPTSRLWRFNKAVQRKRVPAQPKRDACSMEIRSSSDTS